MQLHGKTALVTGGGSGIGLAIALAFTRAGARVAIAGRRDQLLREVVQAWTDNPPILCHRVDVTDRADVQQLVRWADEQLGQVDILVNAGAVGPSHGHQCHGCLQLHACGPAADAATSRLSDH